MVLHVCPLTVLKGAYFSAFCFLFHYLYIALFPGQLLLFLKILTNIIQMNKGYVYM